MTRLLIGCALFLMTACSGGDASDNNSKLPEGSATTAAKAVRDGLKLNDGKPWKADKEMIHRVADMQEMLHDQRAAEKMDQVAVAKDLDNHINEFVESCTMTGQAHEELHKWLGPYMSLIQDFKHANSEAEAKEIMDEMIEMLKIFGEYFE